MEVAFLVIPAASLVAQVPTGPDLSRPLPVDAAVRVGELENGLRYYVRENREPQARAELRLVVNVGSILEEEDQRGLAHLVEHMAFNGTEHFEKQALVDYLERIGMRFGPDVNAYTSFDETVYLLTVPTDSAGLLERGLQILEDWAKGVSFDSLEVEKERGVVIEEWRLGQGAGARMQEKQFPVLLRGSRYAERLPIGTRESLESFRVEAARRFYREWYRPELMAVVAVGDFDGARMEGMIRERFGALPSRPGAPQRREFEVPDHDETIVSVASDSEATSATVSVNMKRPATEWTTAAAYRQWMLEALASGMMTNRLSEWTQRPDSPFLDVSTFQGRFLRPISAYVLTARVPATGVERGLRELLREVTRVRQHGFTRTELEREKVELLRRVDQRYTERDKAASAGFAADYAAHFLYGGTLLSIEDEHELYHRIVPEITLRMVNEVAKDWMRVDNRVVLINMPRSESVRPPREARLHAVIRSVDASRTAPYTDSLSTDPLVSQPPRPGGIVAERTFPAVGVTEWMLENGARILLKPTDFREDEVLVVARSPGGTSILPDGDFQTAVTATAVVQAGGLGELSQLELRKRLAGTIAGVGADISELHEGLSGAASGQDLETLFQLIHLKFTSPRLDSVAIEAYRQQARATLALRSSSPDQAFADTLRTILSQGHPRARPPTADLFSHLDIDRAFAIYADRFADASDFTFYLVGAFSLDSVRPLVERYIASLPSTGRVERGRDVGIRSPSGVVRSTVRRGTEPKARTQIVFTGPFQLSRDNLYQLDALAGVLRIRLRESLREDLSGTYGVDVRAAAAGEPRPRFQLSIGFGADPHRMQELTDVVFEVIDSLRSAGPSTDDILKVREMELRERETELRTNRFWIEGMLSYDQQGWPLEQILEYPAWLAQLDRDLVRRAALLYADPTTHVQVTLLPGGEPSDASRGAREDVVRSELPD